MNFNKVTTALLIAQVQSAPSPLGTATNFPFYATGVTASSDYAASATNNNNGQIKTAFLTNGASAASGGIRAFRTPETFFVVEQNV